MRNELSCDEQLDAACCIAQHTAGLDRFAVTIALIFLHS
jgi:hypothetical protein